MNRRTWLASGAGLAAGLMLLGGCSSSQPITGQTVRDDMSPELDSMAMTSEQRKNANARAVDTTGRQIADDWDSFWLIKRPLRLSEYQIP